LAGEVRGSTPLKRAARDLKPNTNDDIKSAGDNVTGLWNSLKAKVAADKTAWDEKLAQIKHDVSAGLAEDYAEQSEWEASFAIAYAEAAIEEAKAATLDAVAARIEAEKAKGA